jgi:hypothetical protein
MNNKQTKQLLKDIEKVIRTHRNVVVEVNRTEPNQIYYNGVPMPVQTWITETIIIKSQYFYVPD